MSTYEVISSVITAIGALGVLVTLFFLIRQTREAAQQTAVLARSLRDSTMNNTMSRLLTLSEVFVQYPATTKYFYSGADITPEDPDYERVKAIALLVFEVFDYYSVSKRSLPEAWELSGKEWETWMIQGFMNSPVLRRTFPSVKEWFPKALEDLWTEANKRLESAGSLDKSFGERLIRPSMR